MKKIVFILVLLIALLIAGAYIFIPGTIQVNKLIKVNINREGLYRKLADATNWKEWWPGTVAADGSLSLQGIQFTNAPALVMSVPFNYNTGALKNNGEITLITDNLDSVTISINTSIAATANPWKRYQHYFAAHKLADGFSTMLKAITDNYTQITKLYNYNIQKSRVVDSTLMFSSAEITGKPGYDFIYSMIDKIKDYIKNNDAKETGYPMLNIYTQDSVHYLVKVAIPVDKKIPDTKDIHYRWMLGGGNILITEVKGGEDEIQKAYQQNHNYINDYRRIAPAIPFESLVTDRRLEKDSSKWITRIYYPVM